MAKGTIYVPAAGQWTFGVNSDDGFSLDITGYGCSFHSEFAAGRGASDTLATFNFPQAGNYDVNLLWFQGGGGAEAEFFAAQALKHAWDSSFQLVGDVLHGGLAVVRPLNQVNDITGAETVAASPTQWWQSSQVAPVINYVNTGTNGNFGGDSRFPNLPIATDSNDYVVQAKSTVNILAGQGGNWTFGVNSDEGFSLKIAGATFTTVTGGNGVGTDTMQFADQRTSADTFGVVNLAAGSSYDITLTYFERAGASEVELYAAPGSWTDWAGGGTNWRLVGNTANGGLALGIWEAGVTLTAYKANTGSGVGTIDNLTDALSVVANTAYQSYATTVLAPYVNEYDVGGGGGGANFTGGAAGAFNVADQAVPGLPAGVDNNDFVVDSVGYVTIPSAGHWTFGFNSDDGGGIQITGATIVSQTNNNNNAAVPGGVGTDTLTYWDVRGPGDTFGVYNFPAAGDYPIRMLWYERGGGAEGEFYAASGDKTAMDSTFRLVGDTAQGGLAVHRIRGGVFDVTTYKVDTTSSIGTVDNLADALAALSPTGGGDAANGPSAITALNPGQYWRFSETSGTTAANQVAGALWGRTWAAPRWEWPVPTGAFGSPNNAVRFNGVDDAVTTSSTILNSASLHHGRLDQPRDASPGQPHRAVRAERRD